MKSKSSLNCFIMIFSIILFGVFILSGIAHSQSWVALPPYNVLWPLWSPTLSPPDSLTGVPVPLLNSLDKNTYLPVEPALVWDPSLPYFFLLYNYIPSYGDPYIQYFDPIEGFLSPSYSFKTWPPNYMQTATTDPVTGATIILPVPITLPIGYESLFLFDPASWLNFWVPLVNPFWQQYYGVNPYLLTAADLLNPLFSFTATYL